ncbi:DENN domain-containing protein 2C [Hondaea fermentalgiana]|uniref:DENN domain-containing protein 2C n=1 Tax=Hondaea fermentalgiana TaxID=2315210 RepID=A0A2R5GE64_9STRA|nr:DENN domain-containing protein 2C [Hondaea fermentalgiana]|eukprot:GBG28028.1 DENN domain-containing protein 2C [Hondaea fermentalgiana]
MSRASANDPLFECCFVARVQEESADGDAAQQGPAQGTDVFGAALENRQNSKTDASPRRRACIGWKFPRDKDQLDGVQEGVAGLAVFCFPRLSHETRRRHLDSYTYVFSLTLQSGEYLYGFCRKFLPPGRFVRRTDVEARFPEVLCIVSKRSELDLHLRILDCLEGRLMVEPPAALGLLDALAGLPELPAPGAPFRVRSPVGGIACDYQFLRPRPHEKAHTNLVFKFLSPRMVHHLVGLIMNENRIIFVSERETVISLVIHGLLSLIYPFVWQHMFVPLMPEHLLEYLCAPSPFLAGVLRISQPSLENLPLGHVIIADLDKNELQSPGELTPFGEASTEKNMARSRNDDADRISSIFAGEIQALYTKANGSHRQVNDLHLRTTWASFNLFVFGWADRFVDAHTGEIHKEGFVASISDPSLQRFCRGFAHTQMFNHFVERLVEHRQRRAHRNAVPSTTTGGFRRAADMREQQRREDEIFMAALDTIHGEYTWADAKRVIKNAFPPRTCYIPHGAVAEALDAIPTTIRTNPRFDPYTDETFHKLARRSYDVRLAVAANKAIWTRVAHTSAKNWRAGYNAMIFLRFMISAGSEVVLASAYKHIGQVAGLLRIGGELRRPRSVESVKQLHRAAAVVYHALTDRRVLRWERSAQGGHRIFLAMARKTQEEETRFLKCKTSPLPNFRNLHEQLFAPSVTLKPPLHAHLILLPPVPPRKSEDLLGLGAFDAALAPGGTPPPLTTSVSSEALEPTPFHRNMHQQPPPPPPKPGNAVKAPGKSPEAISNDLESSQERWGR